jgi:hypothetical protein
MVVEVAKEKTFIPEWNGNKELAEEEQIKVVHRFLNAGEKQKYYYTKPIQISGGGTETSMEYVQDMQGHAQAVIKRIENYSVQYQDGTVKEIKTAHDLYNTAGVSAALVAEIEGYLANADPTIDTDPTQ